MADLALRLKVFIASPSDLISERDIIEKAVGEVASECARQRILLQSFRWENGVTPGYERPNARTIRQVRTAELTVVMFWSRLGSAARLGTDETGSLEELRIAGESVVSGSSDDVFVYFKTAPPPPTATTQDIQAVANLRSTLEASKEVVTSEFSSELDFENRFRKHLKLWTERWVGVPEICEFALDNSEGTQTEPSLLAEDRLHEVMMYVDLQQLELLIRPLGIHAVDVYQRIGPSAWALPLGKAAAEAIRTLPPDHREVLLSAESRSTVTSSFRHIDGPPLVLQGREFHFAEPAWFAFFCAAGVMDAILASKVEAVVRTPYINDVHQYLKALALERRAVNKLSPVLRRWLVSEDGCTDNRPIARNFAAYVLGMIGAVDAQDDLVRAIQSDRGRDVRLYAVAALGKLRARQQMPVLRDLFAHEADPTVRLMIAQAVCRITGVAEFEM
jgi:hypothetical protein